MEFESAVAGESSAAWVLWCGLPVAALIICFTRISLWLTMPVAMERHALTWALSAQFVSLLAIKPALGVRHTAAMLAVSSLTLIFAWAATDQSVAALMIALCAVALSTALTSVLIDRIPVAHLALKAAILAAILWCVLGG